jgi:hypothetical protein
MKWTEDGLHGFVSTGETFAGQNYYEIAVADWQGRDCIHHSESEIGAKNLARHSRNPMGKSFYHEGHEGHEGFGKLFL